MTEARISGTTTSLDLPLNLDEYEIAARAVLPPMNYGFVAGGAGDEVTLRGNRLAFDGWRLLPRMMAGLASCATRTTVLGREVALPVLVAPTGLQRLVHPEGECASARAARAAGTIYCLSVASSCPIEDVAAGAGPWWLQLYIQRDRGLTRDLVLRAQAAGAEAIVLTVDVPTIGRRETDARNRFVLPDGVTMPNLLPPGADHAAAAPTFGSLTAWEPAVSWADLDWLAGLSGLPVLVKGILDPADARLAVTHGASGVIVSNHGGRQLDSAVAPLDALPAVVAAVAGAVEVLLDGGVRRGTDVLKALALGARAVLIGRPIFWGLAVAGEAGATHVLELLRAELALDLLLCGRASPTEVDRGLVVPVGPLALG